MTSPASSPAFPPSGNILLYTTPDGGVKFDVLLQDETMWLTQKQMADLFGVEVQTINYHLKEIFESGELKPDSVIRKIRIPAEDGKAYMTNMNNLDAIISVGYRVNSRRATQFRIWATSVLREYIIKGFAMDDERLKNPNRIFGKDYFEEQLARIRDIRSSERRFYQKITDIYAQCSTDYDPHAEVTRQFFATVQNKLHFAVTSETAAEIIRNRADSGKKHMGLTTWKNAPAGPIRRTDIGIAKNYLKEEELDSLNRIVSMYLDYAELQARKGTVMYMEDWVKKLDAFLRFNERDILQNSGTVSHEVAIALAEEEYEKFHRADLTLPQPVDRDFEEVIQQLKMIEKKTTNKLNGLKRGGISSSML